VLAQAYTRFARAWQWSWSKHFGGQRISSWFQGCRPFVCRIVGHDTSGQR